MITGLRAACAALALASIAGAAVPASAQTTAASGEGFYVMGAFGFNKPRDSDLDSSNFSLEADPDNGTTFSGGVGYAHGNGLRTELELAARHNDIDDISGAAASGDTLSIALMGNVYYDFDTGSRFKPFIGGGVGFSRLKADGVTPVNSTFIDDSDIALAAQATAGIAYAVTDRMDLTLAYRYFMIPNVTLVNSANTAIDTEYRTHEIMVGLRFAFGGPRPEPEPMPAVESKPEPAPQPEPAPAPQPEAAPAPAPPRNFIVFFDWDSAALTDTAKGIIRSAAEAAKQSGDVRIELTGHADRSGTRRYNQRLSERRGAAVKAELQRLGLPGGEIGVVGKGEEQPLVATNDGVREPRNRRVEILLK